MGRHVLCHRIPRGGISIHPSRVGWDVARPPAQNFNCHFNPPIPCGMGRRSRFRIRQRNGFQSTHPVWDGTDCCQHEQLDCHDFNPPIPCGMGLRAQVRNSKGELFQSTHPVWDGTPATSAHEERPKDFNPPIPCGMGPSESLGVVLRGLISIHPSRVGWDDVLERRAGCRQHFNPPIPCGMGRCSVVVVAISLSISIHPSRVGWDNASSFVTDVTPYFNPPIPCGMGQQNQH